jgi:hypothetical protein
MGLLDDAIREHLELKRRHGADPQEVARQEDEALGPIGGHEPHPDHEAEQEQEDEGVHEDQLALVDEPPAPYEPPTAQEPEHEHEPLHVAEEPAEEPAFELQQPTVEFSIEDEHPAEEEREPAPAEDAEDAEGAEPADELEETPEFLQETPEHDRLWFEQKPPRDFDF